MPEFEVCDGHTVCRPARYLAQRDDDGLPRMATHSMSGASDTHSNMLSESSVGHASSFDEEVFSAQRAVPDFNPTRVRAGSGSDFSIATSDPLTQVGPSPFAPLCVSVACIHLLQIGCVPARGGFQGLALKYEGLHLHFALMSDALCQPQLLHGPRLLFTSLTLLLIAASFA